MNRAITKEVNALWEELQRTIDAAYESGDDELAVLADYRSSSMYNDLDDLLSRESENERKHRAGFSPSGFVAPISAVVAAKLILCGNVSEGSQKTSCPLATIFLVLRKTACEGMTLGYLLRNHVSEEWRERVAKLDYTKIMRA